MTDDPGVFEIPKLFWATISDAERDSVILTGYLSYELSQRLFKMQGKDHEPPEDGIPVLIKKPH